MQVRSYKMFRNCTTLEELKREYHKKALESHPDRGGSVEKMQEVNAMYSKYFELLKNKHKNVNGEEYEKETNETPTEFVELIKELLKMNNCTIEVIGSFVWVTGETKPYKEQLKALEFRFSGQKKAWYLKPKNYHKKTRKKYTLEEIREMHGVQYKKNVKRNELHA